MNKKQQEECWLDPQQYANNKGIAIVYDDQEEKWYTELEYRKACERIVLKYKDKYTDEDWQRDKTNSHLVWYYPN